VDRVQQDRLDGMGDGAPPVRLGVGFESPRALLDAFERELIHGAVFVPTPEDLAPGTRVVVVFDLVFCREAIEVESEVVAPRPAQLAELTPGVSLRLTGAPAVLRRRLVEATGLYLPEPDPTPPGKTIRAPRFDAVSLVEIKVEGRRLIGETANLSYNGMLALISGADFANGTSLRLRIEPAGDGAALELGGRVANQMPCDAGVRALGVQFIYELDRFDEVSQFVDALRSLHHARSLAAVSGSLRKVPLETVLETSAGASSEGTVILRHGDEHGSIAYRDGEIVSAVAGLETGERALARMFCWTEAEFELKPDVTPSEVPMAPLALTSAMLLASVERDELARLDLGRLGPDTILSVDERRLAALDASLDDLSKELVANAAMGFPVATLLDMASASDARVYKLIIDLVDAGVLCLEEG
jgi:Tfp pilus assembly protein PilZ